MKTTKLILIALTFVSVNLVHGQTPEISFHQGKSIQLEETDSGYYQIRIEPTSLTIQFPGDQLHVCTGLSQEIYLHAKPGADINTDYNSCFFLYKYIAMPGDSEFLPIGKDVAAALNETHGAKKINEKESEFTVSALSIENKEQPLKKFEEFYLALWLDVNSDQYIDENEFLRVKVVVE